jgi:catechol 2,3-dioxygenase-like lactoylglutathione lyase family enzyme
MKREPPPPIRRAHFHRTVSDMKTSIDFYVRIGFFYDHGLPELAWLTAPELLLTLAPGEPRVDPGNYFGFTEISPVELEKRYQWLYERRMRLSNPPDTSGGAGHFFLYDPDDYPIMFSVSRLDY